MFSVHQTLSLDKQIAYVDEKQLYINFVFWKTITVLLIYTLFAYLQVSVEPVVEHS